VKIEEIFTIIFHVNKLCLTPLATRTEKIRFGIWEKQDQEMIGRQCILPALDDRYQGNIVSCSWSMWV